MNKKIGIIILLVAVIAVGGYFGYNSWYNSTDNLTKVASEQLNANNYTDALSTYTTLLSREPENISFMTGYVASQENLGNIAEAIKEQKLIVKVDEANAEGWNKLLDLSEKTKVTTTELGRLYTKAYEKTQDASFDQWIQAHQPELPTLKLESGDYQMITAVEVSDTDFDLVYRHDGYSQNLYDYGNMIPLKHGLNEIEISRTNEYGFTQTHTYTYNVDNTYIFKDKAFEKQLKETMGKDSFLLADLARIETLQIMGNKLYVKDKYGEYGVEMNYYSSTSPKYSNRKEGIWYYDYGSLETSEDLAAFTGLKDLSIGMQSSTFIDGFPQITFPKLMMMTIYRQDTFDQNVYEETVLEYPKLRDLELIFTGIKDASQMTSNGSIKHLTLISNYPIEVGNIEDELDNFNYYIQ